MQERGLVLYLYLIMMLRHGLSLICIEYWNDQNFVKIYQNLSKFRNQGKSGNLNFSTT